MKIEYKFTKDNLPFPYNKSDVFENGHFIGWSAKNESGNTIKIDLYEHVYEEVIALILEKDNGAILNALETTERHLSQNEVNDILARHNLTKDEYVKKI